MIFFILITCLLDNAWILWREIRCWTTVPCSFLRYSSGSSKNKQEYKPDIKLEYFDDNGRALTPKEVRLFFILCLVQFPMTSEKNFCFVWAFVQRSDESNSCSMLWPKGAKLLTFQPIRFKTGINFSRACRRFQIFSRVWRWLHVFKAFFPPFSPGSCFQFHCPDACHWFHVSPRFALVIRFITVVTGFRLYLFIWILIGLFRLFPHSLFTNVG